MYQYPYGDTQQLNLDWILTKLKELEAGGSGGAADLEEVSNALISLTYNTSTAYRRYDYAFLNGKLYRCLTDTSGVFDPTAWQEALIGDDLAVLTRWINAIDAAAVVDVKFDTSGTNGKIQQKYHDQYHDVVEVDYTPVQNSKRPLSSNAGYELNSAITSLGSDDIANDSTNVSGPKVTDALNTLNGAITSLGSDDIANDSTNVSGPKVTDALNTLNGAISAITPLDTVPTKDSTKGITSGAVYNGINAFDPTRTYGTISDKYTLRCFGWVSNNGKDLILTCPIGLYVASNISLSLSNTTVNINSVSGVVSLDETQSANYLSSATLFSLGRGIYFTFRNTSGFGITNRTPLTAEINTIFAKA